MLVLLLVVLSTIGGCAANYKYKYNNGIYKPSVFCPCKSDPCRPLHECGHNTSPRISQRIQNPLGLVNSRCGDDQESLYCCRAFQGNYLSGQSYRSETPSDIPTSYVEFNESLSLLQIHDQSQDFRPYWNSRGLKPTGRVYGGIMATPKDHSWLVSIVFEDGFGKSGIHCGGALISKTFVLTAAHCFYDGDKDLYVLEVRIGKWNLTDDRGESFRAKRVFRHLGYSKSSHRNDIALILISKPAIPNSFGSKAIRLPGSDLNQNYYELWGVVAGWGTTEKNPDASYNLSPVEILLQMKTDCCEYAYNTFDSKTQLCFLGTGIGDTCKGDSGSPITLVDGLGRYIVAIVSVGPPNCGTGAPSINTNVREFLTWIHGIIKGIEPDYKLVPHLSS